MGFQSTPPHGGRPLPRPWRPLDKLFQSTPPHGGRLYVTTCTTQTLTVSIHAPAWGATLRHHLHHPDPDCFNPRPRMGGDAAVYDDPETLEDVSIHAPAWGATCWCFWCRLWCDVSIHAPAWGATSCASGGPATANCFNPRPRMGGDFSLVRQLAQRFWFQSTPPHGGRPAARAGWSAKGLFQSTPPHGGRLLLIIKLF